MVKVRKKTTHFKSKCGEIRITESLGVYLDHDSLSIQEEHYSLPDSLINNSAIKACLCLPGCMQHGKKPPPLQGVNLCGRFQLKEISKQNKVQSTFLFRKWLRPVSQISQGLQGFCQLSIAPCACGWGGGGGGGGREREGGREERGEFQCADGAEQPADDAVCPVRGPEESGESTRQRRQI